MNPTIEELRNSSEFELLDVLEHAGIHAWIKPHLRPTAWIPAFYWTLNLAALALVVWVARSAGRSFSQGFSEANLGAVLGFAVLLPVHEYCHALAYRLFGCKGIRIEYQWKRLSALCAAPGAVVNARQFYWVCLAPGVWINGLLILLLVLLPAGKLAVMLSGALLLHVGACSGDVALGQFLWRHRERPLFTFDDPAEPRTYFYAKRT